MGFAQEPACPTADLRQRPWPALHYHQPGKSWCYAIVTSDLVSAEMHTPVSAVSLANFTERSQDSYESKVKAYIYRNNSFLYRFSFIGQSYETAFSVSQKQGMCTYSILDQMRDQPHVKDIYLDDVFYELEKIRSQNPQELRTRLHGLFDSLRAGFAEQVFAQASDKKRPLIDIAVDLSCEKKVDISTLELISRDLNKISEEDAASSISALLTQGKTVGIGYNSKLLYQPRYAAREQTDHASMLVGQYFDQNSKTCKYVIRATDLYTCQVSDPSLKCQNGYFTVNREDALQAMGTFMWLQKP